MNQVGDRSEPRPLWIDSTHRRRSGSAAARMEDTASAVATGGEYRAGNKRREYGCAGVAMMEAEEGGAALRTSTVDASAHAYLRIPVVAAPGGFEDGVDLGRERSGYNPRAREGTRDGGRSALRRKEAEDIMVSFD